MKKSIGFLLTLIIAALAAHWATVTAFPRLAMSQAMERLGAGGVNAVSHAPRTTASSRAVVRPAPDLLYSVCVYDLWQAPVIIQASPSPGYWSLSLYDQRSDNFAVFNDQTHPEGLSVTLVRAGAAAPPGAGLVVESPSRTGIALMRRLAPEEASFAAADAQRQGDSCRAAQR
ncbi:MAG: DUF1254 domain-containing protein [Alphaproteobacteria bacterium]|nr:DUF1254 domain-containing protein [Alphaproteobacteria bacterium]